MIVRLPSRIWRGTSPDRGQDAWAGSGGDWHGSLQTRADPGCRWFSAGWFSAGWFSAGGQDDPRLRLVRPMSPLPSSRSKPVARGSRRLVRPALSSEAIRRRRHRASGAGSDAIDGSGPASGPALRARPAGGRQSCDLAGYVMRRSCDGSRCRRTPGLGEDLTGTGVMLLIVRRTSLRSKRKEASSG